mgnify:CR=1 FL=1
MIVREALPGDDARIGELLVDAFLTVYARKMPEVVYDDARKNDLRDVASKRGRAVVLAAEIDGQGIAKPLLDRAEAIARDEWKVDAI